MDIYGVMKVISGPLVCSLVGYGTNYIAIKMMFRPLNPVYIWGKRLPFTPGIIPARKGQLATAVGNAVGDNLLTANDIKSNILNNSTKVAFTNKLYEEMINFMNNNMSLNEIAKDAGVEVHGITKGLDHFLSKLIVDGAIKMHIGEIIAKESADIINEKINRTLFSKMISDDFIYSITFNMGSRIEEYIDEHGVERLTPIVHEEIHKLYNYPVKELTKDVELNEYKTKMILMAIIDIALDKAVESLLENVNISEMVKKKIDDMDVKQLESLVMSVMKNELNAIVNL
nr:DUF445 family protein [Lachnospiraceae bacterium]